MSATEKKLFAKVGETVFTYVDTGVWEATLYDREVQLNRLEPQKWQCIDKYNKEVLGEGSTRNEAMREAFYEQSVVNGYDAREAVRLDWVLEEQKYRSYGGHKPRRSTKKTTKSSKVVDINHRKMREEEEAVSKINEPIVAPEDQEETNEENAAFSVERLKRFIENYRTAYNHMLGGWVYYQRDEKGRMIGSIHGPFNNETEMFANILENEIERLKA